MRSIKVFWAEVKLKLSGFFLCECGYESKRQILYKINRSVLKGSEVSNMDELFLVDTRSWLINIWQDLILNQSSFPVCLLSSTEDIP